MKKRDKAEPEQADEARPTFYMPRYVKLAEDRDFRLTWAEKIGLGFRLPGDSVGQLGQLVQFRKAV